MVMRVAGVVMAMMFLSGVHAADTTLSTDKQRFSYTIGVQVGDSLLRDGLDLDAKVIGMAIGDVLSSASLRLTAEEMQAAVKIFQDKKAAEMAAVAAANLKKGQAFMVENGKKKGVTSLENGLQYTVLSKGSGKKPAADDTVVVHYRGTLIGGEEFDSSYQRGAPATFGVDAVIMGWQEILPMMAIGSKWQIVIPSELAYGARGTGGQIGPNETLIFDIELLEIK